MTARRRVRCKNAEWNSGKPVSLKRARRQQHIDLSATYSVRLNIGWDIQHKFLPLANPKRANGLSVITVITR